ncbi:hypothetical protein RhiJN_02624 [Ceratobasidium sp. AG-Ba]|nr:hypothetical protein RhiJN_02624 [Ceratobasidium sp. AG-Ba]QRW03497.1 hypothetical protein RhiLY_02496 [Ceratobasidium sp. AG-Ba]
MTSQIETRSASVTTSTPDDVSDSLEAGSLGSPNWWRQARSVSQRTVTEEERSAVVKTSLGGRCCLITREEHPRGAIEMSHLIPKKTQKKEIAELQYAFGRKLDLNGRWFNLYLRADIHASFDHSTDPGWILLPTRELMTEIDEKITKLLAYRRRKGITGPWPDFRSRDWFPTKRTGYEYEFVPLSMAEHNVVICRRDGQGQTPHTLHYPPYLGLRLLRCHVHPYAVIVNVGKKLANKQLPPTPDFPPDRRYEVLNIYTALIEAHKVADNELLSIPEGRSQQSFSSGTGTIASDSATGTHADPPRRSPRISNNDPSAQTPRANDDPLRDFDDSIDNSDGELHEPANDFSSFSQDSLSVSTPNGSTSGTDKNSFFRDRCSSVHTSMYQDCIEWAAEVELARQQGELVDPPDETSPNTRMYRLESSRSPPTENWHSWTSEFAPWWVVLPEPKDRGVVSSNDWAEIENFPSLVRKLDESAS